MLPGLDIALQYAEHLHSAYRPQLMQVQLLKGVSFSIKSSHSDRLPRRGFTNLHIGQSVIREYPPIEVSGITYCFV